jgi:hypothetical protein
MERNPWTNPVEVNQGNNPGMDTDFMGLGFPISFYKTKKPREMLGRK